MIPNELWLKEITIQIILKTSDFGKPHILYSIKLSRHREDNFYSIEAVNGWRHEGLSRKNITRAGFVALIRVFTPGIPFKVENLFPHRSVGIFAESLMRAEATKKGEGGTESHEESSGMESKREREREKKLKGSDSFSGWSPSHEFSDSHFAPLPVTFPIFSCCCIPYIDASTVETSGIKEQIE